MQRREIYFLEWDETNERHVNEHGITAAEVRELLWNRHVTFTNPRGEGRVTLVGETNGGRILSVALDPTRDEGTWRPVTAIEAPNDERGLFLRYCR